MRITAAIVAGTLILALAGFGIGKLTASSSADVLASGPDVRLKN